MRDPATRRALSRASPADNTWVENLEAIRIRAKDCRHHTQSPLLNLLASSIVPMQIVYVDHAVCVFGEEGLMVEEEQL